MYVKCIDKMKVSLILPAEIQMAPYVQYYVSLLDNSGIDYDLVIWNRYGKKSEKRGHVKEFDKVSPEKLNAFSKLLHYWKFVSFAKRQIKKENYDLLIIHTIIPAVLMQRFLLRKYRNKYIFDIRDMCAQYKIMKYFLPPLLNNSSMNVISSPGFKSWLPEGKYVISHNIGHGWEHKCDKEIHVQFNSCLNILTIGSIRHYDINKLLIDLFANREDFKLTFSGRGESACLLHEYCIKREILNVFFTGEYSKNDEDDIVAKADFVNILLPDENLSQQAIANRFYLAILNCKPIIVNEESVQATYVEKYRLGVIVSKSDDWIDKILDYRRYFDEVEYLTGRALFIQELKKDISKFESEMIANMSML